MRYLKLLVLFFKNSVQVEMEYRANFLTNVVLSGLWMASRLVSVLAFFEHRDTIGGWSFEEVLIVIGLFNLFAGFIDAVLRPNIERIVEHIQMGTMDFILTKPVNSQFLASMRHFFIWNFVDCVLGFGVIVYALVRLQRMPSPAEIGLFAILLAAGLVIVYGIWMLLVTMAFWFVQVANIAELFTTFFQAGRFPVSVYTGWIRIMLTFVVPIAMLTTFPAASLLGRLAWTYALASLGMAAVLLVASSMFWNYAVRHYSSASS